MPKSRPPVWLPDPEVHDYPAALSYLSLVMPEPEAARAVEALRHADTVQFKAKDITRAARLPLLGPSNFHVARDMKKVRRGEALSPVLLVRGDAANGAAMTIADGYHRVCASYSLSEDAEIPCRVVDLPQRVVEPVPGRASPRARR